MVANSQVSGFELFYFFFFIGLIVFILLISTIETFRGRKYSKFSVLYRPVLYFILGLMYLAGDFFLLLLPLVLLVIVTGFWVGTRYSDPTLFVENRVLYYKRSILVYVVWLSTFVMGILIGFIYPNDFYSTIVSGGLLMFSGGLLLGESYNIMSSAKIWVW